jgi:hypothetical protein
VNALTTSLIRTLAPILAGWLVSIPAAGPLLQLLGVHDGPSASAAVAGVLGTAYYALVRVLESRWPKLGVLLGVPAPPSYQSSTAVDPDLASAVLGTPADAGQPAADAPAAPTAPPAA